MTEHCRLITEEQYKEWKRVDGENEELSNQLSKVNLLWEKTIKEKKALQKKLDIAVKALEEYANCKPTEWMSCYTADKALKQIKEEV